MEEFIPSSSPDVSNSGEGNADISPEDLVRVQESIGNARKATGQTMKAQRTTKQYALMLTFIFKYVNDERLLGYVYELMTKHQISTTIIFGHFLPHLKDYMDIAPYKPLYSEIWDELEGWKMSLTHIVKYYKDLYAHFPQLEEIGKEKYAEMVMKQLEYFQVVDVKDKEMMKKVRESLEGEIFEEK